MPDQLGISDIPQHNVRSTDPETSQLAAWRSAPRWASQRGRILQAFVASHPRPLIAEQAAQRSGVPYQRASTRTTELRRGGWLVPTGETALTSAGHEAQLLTLTGRARDELGIA